VRRVHQPDGSELQQVGAVGLAGMTHKPIDVYLNDHLAGAMLGSDLADQIQPRSQDTPLGELMQMLASINLDCRQASPRPPSPHGVMGRQHAGGCGDA
jgi:hypothetical protein